MGERIGLYGGTFSPPHKGHIQAARAAAKQLALDRLLLMPVACPPHKEVEKGTPSPEARLEMLHLAAEGIECAEISDIEIRRGGKSYTVDTIERLMEIKPEACFFLLMGSDMFFEIEQWYKFDAIMKYVVLAPFARADGEQEQIMAFAEFLREKYGAKVSPVINDALEISSTHLRELLPQRRGLSYLEDGVYSYIIKNRLFKAKPDFSWLRAKAYAWVSPKRVPHVAGCEEEAVRLCRHWGADEEEAREAAILHDITKRFELDEQLILCEKYGIITDNIEKTEKKLLHSKTGAAVAKYEFGVSDAVFSAIKWHTTGRADMTLFEKIIYMADYIEPTRNFEEVGILRAMSYDDIDAALLMGLEISVEDMRVRGIVPHPETVRAISFLQKSKGTMK